MTKSAEFRQTYGEHLVDALDDYLSAKEEDRSWDKHEVEAARKALILAVDELVKDLATWND